MSEEVRHFRVYGSWQGLPADSGEVTSSFSNLRLQFSAPVADGGQPGLTSPEELLLGAAVSAYCTAFMQVAEQMALDVADLQVEGSLTRSSHEIEGVLLTALTLRPMATLRTGMGFEKVHDMFRRAAGLAQHRSPVLRALAGTMKMRIEPEFSAAR